MSEPNCIKFVNSNIVCLTQGNFSCLLNINYTEPSLCNFHENDAMMQLVEAPEGRGFDFLKGDWDFSMTQSFWPRYASRVDLASDRN
jgi:hypothetical protein